MAGLPAQGYTSNSARTVAEVKVAVENIRDTAAQMPGGTAREELTISGGAIVPPDGSGGGWFRVDTEGNAATDDLASITTTNCWDGMLVWLGAENTGRVVTIKHGTGNISLEDGTDLDLTDLEMWVELQLRSSTWVEVKRHYKRIAFEATPASDQGSVGSGSWTNVAFATEAYDDGSAFSTPSFTAPYAGEYLFTWVVGSVTSFADQEQTETRLYKNGTTVVGGTRDRASGSTRCVHNGSRVIRLARGDTVTVQFLQSSGSSATLDGDGSSTGIPMHFAGRFLRG